MRPYFKAVWITVIVALVSISATVFAQPPLQEGGLDAVITESASLRSGPGTDWRRISVLETGSVIRLDGQATGWARGISQNGDVGWVINTALGVPEEQILALPIVWTDTPFTLSAPPGGAPQAPAQPESQPQAEAPAGPVVNTAPVRGFMYGGHVDGFSGYSAEQMARAGMTWVKRQWRYQPGQNPAETAGWINEAHGRGFRILLAVVGSASDVTREGYFAEYASFVGGVAAQGADAIEIWNEPNIDREWAAGSISAALYTDLLRQSYQAIKATNPNTMVISGAPAPTGYFGGCSGAGCDDNLYVQGMAAAGAANYMDCLGIHYNEGIVPPTQTSGDPRGSSGHYSRYFQSMINTYWRAFNGARPLCFTEMGYLTPEGFGPLSAGFAWGQNVTLAQQAQWLDQAVSLAARSGRVRLLIVWNIDFTNYDDDPMAGFAIIRPDGSCPACDALAN